MARGGDWDFTLPAPAPAVQPESGRAWTCAFGSAPDSWTVSCPERAVYEAEGSWWCMAHGPLSSSFRLIPTTGIRDAMVFCVGCGEPMPLNAALAHTCDLPPAGML